MRTRTSKAVIVTDATNFKYAPKKGLSKSGKDRKMFPHNWVSGPDLLTHDIYYAWLKHKAQAAYRKEPHSLTWDDWQTIWSNPIDFENRGRRPEDLTLTRIDDDGAWTLANVEVITRLEQLRKARDKTMRERQKK
jgi:hypothetical protein